MKVSKETNLNREIKKRFYVNLIQREKKYITFGS